MGNNPLADKLAHMVVSLGDRIYVQMAAAGNDFKDNLCREILPFVEWPSVDLVKRANQCFLTYCTEEKLEEVSRNSQIDAVIAKDETNSLFAEEYHHYNRLVYFVNTFTLARINTESYCEVALVIKDVKPNYRSIILTKTGVISDTYGFNPDRSYTLIPAHSAPTGYTFYYCRDQIVLILGNIIKGYVDYSRLEESIRIISGYELV